MTMMWLLTVIRRSAIVNLTTQIKIISDRNGSYGYNHVSYVLLEVTNYWYSND